MTLNELDKYFRSFLKIENYLADVSKNGIQIQNSEPDKKTDKKSCVCGGRLSGNRP